jgi:LysR family transcriptional regulator, nitrogen assimilation regulatory protein
LEMKQLRYFLKAAELSSVGKAADCLNVAQPTLSRQIKALETELKTDLFARNGRGVCLTATGRRFLDQARGILNAADRAALSLNEGKSAQEGRVVCGFTQSVGPEMVPSYVDSFSRRFPNAHLSIVEGYSSVLTEQVLLGKLDFAILLNPKPSPQLLVDSILEQSLYLIGPKKSGSRHREIALSDIAKLPLIMPHTLHTIRLLLENEAARLGLDLQVAVEVDAVRSISDLVERGRGFTVTTKTSLRRTDHRHLHWRKISSPDLKVSLCMIRPMKRSQSPLSLDSSALARATLLQVLRAD